MTTNVVSNCTARNNEEYSKSLFCLTRTTSQKSTGSLHILCIAINAYELKTDEFTFKKINLRGLQKDATLRLRTLFSQGQRRTNNSNFLGRFSLTKFLKIIIYFYEKRKQFVRK